MPWILTVVSDLMFTVKIQDAAKKAGIAVTLVASHPRALEKLKEGPALVILDLQFDLAKPMELIAAAKAAGVPTLGYLPHVNTELKKKAVEAGCTTVLARSVFAEKLGELIGTGVHGT